MNLRTKLWLLLIGSTIVSFIFLFGITWLIAILSTDRYNHETLQQIGHAITSEIEENDLESEAVKQVLDRVSEQHPDLMLDWFTAEGQFVYSTSGRQQPYTYEEQMNRFLNMPSKMWISESDVTFNFAWDVNGERHFLMMTLPSEVMQSRQLFLYIRNGKDYIWFLLPIVLFIGTPYVFSAVFFSRMNRRITALNDAMGAVDPKQSVVTIESDDKDEIGQLIHHFNQMSRRITEQVEQLRSYDQTRTTLLANLSHDLRTPMTTIQGCAETLYTGLYRSEADMKRYADIILRRSHYMDRLIQKMLEISQLDMIGYRVQLEFVNLSELIRRIAADFVQVLENKKISFHLDVVESPLMVKLDMHLIERALRNLIENAIQYGSEGGYLSLALEEKDHHIKIAVTDHGPGISKEQQAFVFDRFYRGTDGREGEGIGVGLSIVKEVAVAHQGTIELQSEPGRETTFRLILPKVN